MSFGKVIRLGVRAGASVAFLDHDWLFSVTGDAAKLNLFRVNGPSVINNICEKTKTRGLGEGLWPSSFLGKISVRGWQLQS